MTPRTKLLLGYSILAILFGGLFIIIGEITNYGTACASYVISAFVYIMADIAIKLLNSAADDYDKKENNV